MSKGNYEIDVCSLCKVRDNDSSPKRLYKCKHCGKYFCKKHLKPKHTLTPIQIQRLENPSLRDKLYEEWRKEDAHPCPAYTFKILEEYEKKTEGVRIIYDKKSNDKDEKIITIPRVVHEHPQPIKIGIVRRGDNSTEKETTSKTEIAEEKSTKSTQTGEEKHSKIGIIIAGLVAGIIILLSIILTLTNNNVSTSTSNLLSFNYLIIESNSSCSLIISEKVVNKDLPPEKMEEVLNQICSERCEYFNLKGIGYECKNDKLSCKCNKTSYVVSKEFELPLSCAYMTSINVNNDCQKICESRFTGLNLTYSTACKENRIFCICTLNLKYTTQLIWIKKEFEKT